MAITPVKVDVDLTKPLTVFIKKVSNAAGILYEPRRIREKAKAEAEAKITIANAEIEINDLQRRALQRLVHEEAKNQQNLEGIIGKAIPQIQKNAEPEKLNDDWLVNFFDKAKLTSDEEMQLVWSRLLAGETNSPGTFSRRTINLVAELEKKDARLFSTLANFAWIISEDGSGQRDPLIFDHEAEIYKEQGLGFETLNHLDSLGLIRFGGLTTFSIVEEGQKGFLVARYQKATYKLKARPKKQIHVSVGQVVLTNQGRELIKICNPERVVGFEEYALELFRAQSLNVGSVKS